MLIQSPLSVPGAISHITERVGVPSCPLQNPFPSLFPFAHASLSLLIPGFRLPLGRQCNTRVAFTVLTGSERTLSSFLPPSSILLPLSNNFVFLSLFLSLRTSLCHRFYPHHFCIERELSYGSVHVAAPVQKDLHCLHMTSPVSRTAGTATAPQHCSYKGRVVPCRLHHPHLSASRHCRSTRLEESGLLGLGSVQFVHPIFPFFLFHCLCLSSSAFIDHSCHCSI